MGRPRGASQSAGRLAELVQTNRDGVNLVVDLVMSDDDAQAALAVQAFLEIEPEGRFIDWLGVLGVAMARGPEAEDAARWLWAQVEAAAGGDDNERGT